MGCSTREKSVRNKRRLRSNNPSVTIRSEENLPDCRRNIGIATETVSKPMIILDGASVEEKTKDKEVSSEENEEADWGYCTEEQLEDLLLKSLEFVYNDAVCKIASEGYSGEDALRAVLRNGHYYGSGDLLFNIVKNATSYLENNTLNCSDEADLVFRDLKQLEEYALTGMVCMLRQLRPQLSKGDAMWCLLMSDLHVGRASTLEIPTLPPIDERTKSNGIGPPPLTVISMPSPTRPSCSSSNFVPIGAISEPCRMCAKRTSGFNIAEADTPAGDNISLPQNGFTFDAGTSKLPSSSIAQSSPNVSGQSSTKLSMLRRNSAALLPARLLRDWKPKSDLCSQSDGSSNEGLVSTFRPGKLQTQSTNSSEKNQLLTQDVNSDAENAADSSHVVAAATELSLGLASPVDAGQDQYKEKPRSCPDIVGAILGSLEQMGIAEKSDAVDQRHEMVVKLMHQIRDLEMQLKERTEWAQQRALQAARKLSKDLAELKTLRMDRDEMLRLRKDKQTVEETAIKRLSEMENDLRKVSGKVDQANAAARRLETENAEVRAEMEASKLSAAESVSTCQEVEKRERKGLRRAQTWEKQKSRLQDEINEVKQRTVQVQQQLSLIKDMQQETEAKLKEEEKAKEIAIAQAEEERGAKDAAEASSKRREEVLHRKIEMDFQRHKDDIERLEQELARLKATEESCQLNIVSHAPHAVDEDSVKSLKEMNVRLHSKLLELQESSRRAGNRDRECIMCINEEVSVVFLPCAHQVLCVECNGSHEKKGLKDCPSCRSPIQQRIHVYGVSS